MPENGETVKLGLDMGTSSKDALNAAARDAIRAESHMGIEDALAGRPENPGV
jgi:hypothetical protein